MAIAMPNLDQLPAGPVRSLVEAVFRLYDSAGRPASRMISMEAWRNHDLESVSHETVSALLRGRSVPSWQKLRSIATVLIRSSVRGDDELDATLQNLQALWQEAVGEVRAATLAVSAERRPLAPTALTVGQPFTVDRMTVTHYLRGRSVVRSTTERWIFAEEDDVSKFLVYRRIDLDAPNLSSSSAGPLLNCRRGEVRRVDTAEGAAEVVEIILPRPLRRGEGIFFGTESVDDDGASKSFVEVQETTRRIRRVTIRVQFDTNHIPSRCWYFAAVSDVERLIPPPVGGHQNLFVSEVGYIEWEVHAAMPAAKYGIAWQWD